MKYTLLLVDDEPQIVKALQRALDNPQYDFQVATSSDAALELLKNTPVDLILCDYQMSGMLGIDVLKYAKSVQPNAVRILVTGSADMNVAIAAINQGSIYYFVSKPWDNDELIKVVADGLAGRKQREDRESLIEMLSISNENLLEVNRKLNSLSTLLEARAPDKSAGQGGGTRKISVKDDDNIVMICPDDILYLAAAETAVSVITTSRLYKSEDSLTTWEERLGPDFFRCHRGFIVNLDQIDKVSPWFNGAYNIRLRDRSDNIPVSRSYAKKLKELLDF